MPEELSKNLRWMLTAPFELRQTAVQINPNKMTD